MIENKGEEVLSTVGHALSKLRSETIWHPQGLSNESMINLVEIKAMLVYAERKINAIAVREGF